MELAIGAVDMGNEKKPMCAPESAIAKRCSRYAIIVPGKKALKVLPETSPRCSVWMKAE